MLFDDDSNNPLYEKAERVTETRSTEMRWCRPHGLFC